MEDIEEFIKCRLNKIDDLEDRKLLKKVLYDVFINLHQYDMQMYENLEKRVYQEIDDPLNKYYIYSTLIDSEEIDPISNFFHPIAHEQTKNVKDEDANKNQLNDKRGQSDTNDEEILIEGQIMREKDMRNNPSNIKLAELCEQLRSGELAMLDCFYLSCTLPKFEEIINSETLYNCTIKTDLNNYLVNVRVAHCRRYLEEIENLYHVYQLNGKLWSTLNCPYAYRFVEIYAVKPVLLQEGETILDITVDLGAYNDYIQRNKVPVWNVQPVTFQDKAFPMPAKNKVHFEHMVSHGDGEIENGYLITPDNMEFTYITRYPRDLAIISPYADQQEWNLLRVANKDNLIESWYPEAIMTNARRMGFSGRFASKKALVIRTKAEMDRILFQYEMSDELRLVGLSVLDSYEKTVQTINYNYFVEDNIRIDDQKKILLLRFYSMNTDDYLVYDKMSFFTSEIQMLFPEFRLIGELVE